MPAEISGQPDRRARSGSAERPRRRRCGRGRPCAGTSAACAGRQVGQAGGARARVGRPGLDPVVRRLHHEVAHLPHREGGRQPEVEVAAVVEPGRPPAAAGVGQERRPGRRPAGSGRGGRPRPARPPTGRTGSPVSRSRTRRSSRRPSSTRTGSSARCRHPRAVHAVGTQPRGIHALGRRPRARRTPAARWRRRRGAPAARSPSRVDHLEVLQPVPRARVTTGAPTSAAAASKPSTRCRPRRRR